MQKIVPFLWFDDKAEEAADFYVSIFKNSKINDVTRYGEGGPQPKGTVMTVQFQLDGQDFVALNGGAHYTFSPAISLVVNCETQDEIDAFSEKLSAGGETQRCGWLTDKYGVTWQVVPSGIGKLFQDSDAARSTRVMAAIMEMDKLDINGLQEAYRQ